jgi:hypothetical protein
MARVIGENGLEFERGNGRRGGSGDDSGCCEYFGGI